MGLRGGQPYTGLVREVTSRGKWTSDDWTNKPFKTYCRDLKSERIESLIIILSNSDIENTLQPQGKYPPILQVTNIGGYAWKGSADLRSEVDGRVEKMKVSDLLLKATGDVPDSEETPLRRQFSPVTVSPLRPGTFHWSISGSQGGCGFQAPDQVEELNPGNFLFTFPYAKSPAPGARGVLPPPV